MPERQTMLALWSLAGAPLILGADLTHLTPADRTLLENRAVLAVDQDRTAADRVLDAGPDRSSPKLGRTERGSSASSIPTRHPGGRSAYL
jgi:hypothetical protein